MSAHACFIQACRGILKEGNDLLAPLDTALQCTSMSSMVTGKVVSWPCTTMATLSPTSSMSMPAVSTCPGTSSHSALCMALQQSHAVSHGLCLLNHPAQASAHTQHFAWCFSSPVLSHRAVSCPCTTIATLTVTSSKSMPAVSTVQASGYDLRTLNADTECCCNSALRGSMHVESLTMNKSSCVFV